MLRIEFNGESRDLITIVIQRFSVQHIFQFDKAVLSKLIDLLLRELIVRVQVHGDTKSFVVTESIVKFLLVL